MTEKARWVRRQVLEMAAAAGEGHVSSAYSCVEILVALYHGGILKFDPKNPKWDGRDRLILSKGHGVLALYPILAALGFFPEEELMRFCHKDSFLGIHAEWHCPGVEAVTGSLGHGFGLAVGMALAAKMDRKPHRVFVLLGDGECYEGQIWEAAMFAAHHSLDNLTAIVDRNRLCVTGFTEELVGLEPFHSKWAAFGWEVHILNGHSFDHLLGCFPMIGQKPRVVIANTVKGKGLSFMENEVMWHGVAVTGDRLEQARRELGNVLEE